MVWVAEPGVQGVGIHIAMAMDPIDFVGEGAVEDAGVVGGNCEIDVGFEEGVDGQVSGVGDAADAEVGGGAGFDDGAKLGKMVEDVFLAFGDVFKALGIIRAFDGFIGRSIFKGLLFKNNG